jgi:hypothetical protein
MWGEASENEFLIFCLEVAISLRVMRPTSSDACKTHGGVGGCYHVDRCILPLFQKPYREC